MYNHHCFATKPWQAWRWPAFLGQLRALQCRRLVTPGFIIYPTYQILAMSHNVSSTQLCYRGSTYTSRLHRDQQAMAIDAPANSIALVYRGIQYTAIYPPLRFFMFTNERAQIPGESRRKRLIYRGSAYYS
jgi:hypothetical protein